MPPLFFSKDKKMFKAQNVPAGLQIIGGSTRARVPRTPKHTFNIRHKPFQITPFMIAPVLAGETLKNMNFSSRAVTDPVVNRLCGWWLEHMFFYVKLRDLDAADEFAQLVLADAGTIPTDAVAKALHYHHSGINYVDMCLDRIVDCYFRDEGETVSIAEVDNLPLAGLMHSSWVDSVYKESELATDVIDQTPTADIPYPEFEKQYAHWQFIRGMQVTEMSFEDYMGTFGIRASTADHIRKPELVRWTREWQYPTNTIADDGTASTAVSWSVSGRADKDRLFKEPGFVVGVTLARPKVYLGNQREAAVHTLDTALSWLPAVMKEEVYTSLKDQAAGTGPLGGLYAATPYVLDVRDIFIHGDQFVNHAGTSVPKVSLPNDDHTDGAYPTAQNLLDFFVDAAGTKTFVEQDGVVDLNILGTQVDHT